MKGSLERQSDQLKEMEKFIKRVEIISRKRTRKSFKERSVKGTENLVRRIGWSAGG